MNNIGSFFEKFKNFALKDMYRKEAVSSAVYKIIKQKIDIKDISIKDRISFDA